MFSLINSGTTINWLDNLLSAIMSIFTIDMLLYIFAGLMLVIIIANAIRLIWSYESKSMRTIKMINKYLSVHTSINDSNLVEFNARMKHLPSRIRERWQLFMLERIGSPSRYLSVEYCVKRPLYNSAVLSSLNQIKLVTIILTTLSLLLSIVYVNYNSAVSDMSTVLIMTLTVPSIVCVIGIIYCMILQARYKYLNVEFYDTFAKFVRNVDKASNTMPDYVDYELLFTKKEIDNGIPVLREYLEKRALEEQRLLEKAKRDEVEHSPYNFDDLGINGAQLIERAVDESEDFLLHKIHLTEEITNLEKQYQVTVQNMDDIERDANKKLQAIKENLERLDKAIQETSNRVEINYNRRQVKEEMDKKAMLEKDLQAMLDKEKVAQDALRVEIEKRKEEIETNKVGVEDALKAEYNTFATKVYDEIYQKILQETAGVIRDYENQIIRLKSKLKELSNEIDQKETIISEKTLENDNLKLFNEELNSALNKKKKKHFEETKDQDAISVPDMSKVQVNNDVYNASHEDNASVTNNLINPTIGVENGSLTNDYNQYYDSDGNMIDYSNQGNLFDNSTSNTLVDNATQNVEDYNKEFVDNTITTETNNDDSGDNGANVMEMHSTENVDEINNSESTINLLDSVDSQDFESKEVVTQDKPIDDKFVSFDFNKALNDGINTEREVEHISYDSNYMPQHIDEQKENTEQELTDEQQNDLTEAFEHISYDETYSPSLNDQEKREKVVQVVEEAEETAAKMEKAKIDNAVSELKEKNNETAVEEKTKKAKKETKTENKEETSSLDKDDLVELQKQIDEENEKLKKKQDELRNQIDKTLNAMETKTNPTKAEKQKNVKKIKDLVDKLKEEAKEAKARGASKKEINAINKKVAEILKSITDYQDKN